MPGQGNPPQRNKASGAVRGPFWQTHKKTQDPTQSEAKEKASTSKLKLTVNLTEMCRLRDKKGQHAKK